MYDLRVGVGNYKPLPLSRQKIAKLQTAALDAIRKVPGGPSAVLSTYSENPTEWDIPPLYFSDYKGVPLCVGAIGLIAPKGNYKEDFDKLVSKFAAEGWSPGFESMLERRVGGEGLHPSVFSKTGGLAQFVVEYVVAAATTLDRPIITNGLHFALKVMGAEGYEYIGIVDNKIVGTDIVVKGFDLYEMTINTRGSVITKSYGVYDRALKWADESFEYIDDADKFKMALSLLKLSSDPDKLYCPDEAAFEQRVRLAKGVKLQQSLSASRLTYEKFSDIRKIWLVTEKTPEEAFQDLLTALVPEVYDSVAFKKLFGMLPTLDEPLTKRQLNRIDRGIDLFSQDFARMKE